MMTSWNRLYVSIHITILWAQSLLYDSYDMNIMREKGSHKKVYAKEKEKPKESNEQDLHKAPLFEQFVWMKMSLSEKMDEQKINDDTRHAFSLSKINDVMDCWRDHGEVVRGFRESNDVDEDDRKKGRKKY